MAISGRCGFEMVRTTNYLSMTPSRLWAYSRIWVFPLAEPVVVSATGSADAVSHNCGLQDRIVRCGGPAFGVGD